MRLRPICILVLVESVVLRNASAGSTSMDASMTAAQKARAAYRAGRYAGAARGYKRAYELYPQLSYLEKVAKAYGKTRRLVLRQETHGGASYAYVANAKNVARL